MKKYVIFLLITLCLVSCRIKTKYETVYSISYVAEYYYYHKIELMVSANNEYFQVRALPTTNYGILSGKTPKYYEKCESHGDTGYKGGFLYGPGVILPTYQDRDFIRIEIRSDADYDAAHPAGTLLNDLFYFSSMSPIKYIQNGYINPYDWQANTRPDYYENYNNYGGLECSVPVYGLLSELGPEDWVLLGGNDPFSGTTFAAFTPVRPPEGEKVHNFTLTLTDTEDKVLTASVRFEFP